MGILKKILIVAGIIIFVVVLIMGFEWYGKYSDNKTVMNQFEIQKQYVNKVEATSSTKESIVNDNSGSEDNSNKHLFVLFNKEALTGPKYFHPDGMLVIDSILASPVNSLIEICKATADLNDQQLQSYYNKNTQLISLLYKITDLNSFMNFQRVLKTLKGSNSIESGEVKLGSVGLDGDAIKFTIVFKTDKGLQAEFNLTAVENADKNKELYTISWTQ